MSQGRGEVFLRAWFGLDNFGEDVLYPRGRRSRVRGWGAAGCPAADFNHQTRGQVWRLILLGSSCGQQSRDVSRTESPLPGGLSPPPTQPRGGKQAVCSQQGRGRGCATVPAEGRPS